MSDEPTEDCPALSRRRFLGAAGAAACAAAATPAALTVLHGRAVAGDGEQRAAKSYYPPPKPGVRYGMVIDIEKCIGCRRCAYACRKENNVGRDSGFAWIELHKLEKGHFELETSEVDYEQAADPDAWYLPAACMQCENPPCVQACPVKATYQDSDGIVLVDYDKCIGCRYCVVNCPYGARHFNWKRPVVPDGEKNPKVPVRPIGVVEKCTFCVHRTRVGRLPACVEACPVGARVFGDLKDPESGVSTQLRERVAIRVKEHLGTNPSVYYTG